MKPLTIKVKRPSVRRIAGSEKITITGLRILLTMEKINPASRKLPMPAVTSASLKPVPKSSMASQIPNVLSSQRVKNIANCRLIMITVSIADLLIACRESRAEVLASTFGDEDVIFDPHADTFFGNVDTRLNRQYHTRFKETRAAQ